jgi:lipopolysaccharide export LptBFGC system permease protein LptF
VDGVMDSMNSFNFDGTGTYNRNDQVGWTETPWVLMSGSLTPEFLGVPQLLSYINANHAYGDSKLAPFRTQLYYRFAQPWQTFIVVLAAAPLGIVFSRRGLLGGVASSISIFFILLFIDHLFLNLGKGRHLPPWLAVWLPHLILGTFGLYMFSLRSRNKDLPKLGLKSLRDGVLTLWELFRALMRGPKTVIFACFAWFHLS